MKVAFRQHEGVGDLDTVCERLVQARSLVSDIRAQRLLEELEIDLRALLDQRCSGWAGVVEEDLSTK